MERAQVLFEYDKQPKPDFIVITRRGATPKKNLARSALAREITPTKKVVVSAAWCTLSAYVSVVCVGVVCVCVERCPIECGC